MLIVKTKAVSFWYVAVGYDIYKAYLCYFSVLDSPHLLVLMISIYVNLSIQFQRCVLIRTGIVL